MTTERQPRQWIGAGVVAFALGFLLGFSSCQGTMALDHSVSPTDANAATLVLGGCGELPHKRYVFCEVRETANPTEEIVFYLPEVKCSRATCIQLQLTRLDGSFGQAFSVPPGQTELRIPISQVIGSDTAVALSADGEYQVGAKVYFIGPDGEEHLSNMKGYIRLSVLRADYVPVACNDPLIAWDTPLEGGKGCHAQWTTQLRSALCGVCRGT